MTKKIVIGLVIIFSSWIIYQIYIGNTYYTGHKSIVGETGEYELVWGSPYGGFTSLGYAIYGEIDSLKQVKWNNRMIVLEQNIENENRWAIIIPKSDLDTILKRMQDTLIRNLDKYQIDSIAYTLKGDTFVIEDLKPEIVERCYY